MHDLLAIQQKEYLMEAKLVAADPKFAVPDRRQALDERLTDGYQRIEQALREDRDVRAWEDFWIQLLSEYEALCDSWPEAA